MPTSPSVLRACVLLLVLAGCGGPPSTPVDAAPADGGDRDAITLDHDASVPPDAPVDSGVALESHDVLFVGNSYVFTNDVAGHYRGIATALPLDVRVEEVTAGGYRLAQHAVDANTDGTALAGWLRTGTAEETAFDAVILQEQSQIGGFPEGNDERMASLAAASELSALAGARGARTVLYMTWGYRDGDLDNAGIGYGTYSSMQDRIEEGYRAMAAMLVEQGSDVRVAPVGPAFRTVFEDVTLAGGDPMAVGSDFHALYEGDGSHPSLQGAYLASCVLAGTILDDVDVRTFIDEETLGADVSARLRDVCARTLAEP